MIVDDDWLKDYVAEEDFKAIPSVIVTRNLNLWFGQNHVLKSVNLEIKKNRITAIIGPSGCGKTTLIRTFNRMCDLDNARLDGELYFDGRNILSDGFDVVTLRRKIGMVFQKPNPFPKSIYDNVAYGPIIHGVRGRRKVYQLVQESLKKAALWDEVKDRLKENALGLSGGQQQRLCIARALAVDPEILLMDEPCSALDPLSTAKIEDLMNDLKESLSIVIVTHNMQQAARVSDYTAFMYLGELVEFGPTGRVFENPKEDKTKAYVMGRFG